MPTNHETIFCSTFCTVSSPLLGVASLTAVLDIYLSMAEIVSTSLTIPAIFRLSSCHRLGRKIILLLAVAWVAKKLIIERNENFMTISIVEIVSDTAHLSKQKIHEVIKEHEDKILYVSYILHDKDKYTVCDEEREEERAAKENRTVDPNVKAGNLKKPHYHVMILFAEKKRPSSFKTIANWFGLDENCANKCNSRKGSLANKYDDMCAYLCHFNAEEKHQYDISEVWANFDFNARIERWKSNFSFSHIMKDILDGKITEKNYTKYISGDLYAQHRAKIESAFAFCRDKNKTLNRNMDVIMIYGPGGVGKTTYAKMLAESKGFDTSDIFVSSSGEDILCGYRGEGSIIIYDFTKEQMTFGEFLKMTDNNTNSSVRSRYTNKNISNCKLMIVTSIFPLEKLFVGNNGEDMVQLYRRFKLQLKVDAATITPYAYVKSIKSFLPTSVSYPNPVQQLVIASQTTELRTDQDVFNFLCVAVSPATATKTFEERGEEQKNNNN